jgi:hypothetical protein
LKKRRSATGSALPNNPAASTPDRYIELLGVTTKEFEEAGKDLEWLDMHRHGFRSKMKIDLSELMKEKEIVEKYNLSHEHLAVFQDFADDYKNSIDEWMVKMEQMSKREGIPLQELALHILRQIATRAGMPEEEIEKITRRPPPPITSSSRRSL